MKKNFLIKKVLKFFREFLSKHRKANQGRTEIIRNDLNPVWNYKTVFSIFRKNIQIQIQVKERAHSMPFYVCQFTHANLHMPNEGP